MIRKALGFLLKVWGAFSLLAVLLGGALLLTAGWWLPVNDELKPADAIVLLAGDPRRARHTADLYMQGLAPVIYTGRPAYEPDEPGEPLAPPFMPEEERIRLYLIAKGVPKEAVVLYGQNLLSTVDEGEHLARLLPPQAKTVIVVTSPYHCRRAKIILSRLLPGRELIFSPPPYERFEPKWWTHQPSARQVLLESAKFLFYYLGRPFRAEEATRQGDPGQTGEAGRLDGATQPAATRQAG
ncbi:MAG TPA: YdcF family protein [Humidesulfovibrio sp.]|uniref:YdcF family protein n=1 Tax=Humidesulfovibrio sp. TaxID=2910988 RepID=UPI002BCDF33E|nr:YdcF family protein [Humidesulfovibrio sp.]HWR02868.1 YdcF family protein [Humidesulfovibrio sp.]